MDNNWTLKDIEPPWGDRPSIFDHIASHIVPGEHGLSESGYTLPDEEIANIGQKLTWAAGAQDGVSGAGGDQDLDGLVEDIVEMLEELSEEATSENALAVYALLTGRRALEYADPLLQALSDSTIDSARLREVARWLATEAPDREPVKAGIAMLALSETNDRDVIMVLGRHEEFTLFAVATLSHVQDDPEGDLFELAKSVTGWGRIQVIENLADTEDEEIHAWMLREGYSNWVMNEYTACIIAETANLAGALDVAELDEDLLRGAGEILLALIEDRGGPAEGIGEYVHGVRTTELYLDHLRRRKFGLLELNVLHVLKEFLEGRDEYGELDDESEIHDPALGWPKHREELLGVIHELLARPGLERMVRESLESSQTSESAEYPESAEFAKATLAAPALGIDLFPYYVERLERGESMWWGHAARTEDPERMQYVVEAAPRLLSLSEIPGEPTEDLGLGPGWEADTALLMILQELPRFPGVGGDLILTGLQSPLVRTRNHALRSLSQWEREEWPQGTEDTLWRVLESEPQDSLREEMERVLSGDPLE